VRRGPLIARALSWAKMGEFRSGLESKRQFQSDRPSSPVRRHSAFPRNKVQDKVTEANHSKNYPAYTIIRGVVI
jgi:hypothetical protein